MLTDQILFYIVEFKCSPWILQLSSLLPHPSFQGKALIENQIVTRYAGKACDFEYCYYLLAESLSLYEISLSLRFPIYIKIIVIITLQSISITLIYCWAYCCLQQVFVSSLLFLHHEFCILIKKTPHRFFKYARFTYQ